MLGQVSGGVSGNPGDAVGEMLVPSDSTVRSVSNLSSSTVSLSVGPVDAGVSVCTVLYEGGAPEVALFPVPLLPPTGVSWTHHCCCNKRIVSSFIIERI